MQSEGVVQALQLIDQHKQFKGQSLDKVLEGMKDCEKDYFNVAIIGAQNSGKSTLLNYLFKTNFQVLTGSAGTRTTRGVVLGRDYEKNLILMDVQGNDSWQNHFSGDQGYQKMVSSFALVSANLLMVNIFLKQLGQQQGSQYATLQTVIRICIDQFKQQSPKTILFCLRDANPQYFNQTEYRIRLQNDMQKVWKGVWVGTKRQEEFKKYETSADRFYTLEMAFLRQYDRDYPEDFIEDVGKLRQRFIDPSDTGYLFKKVNKEYNIPAHDLPMLLQNIWQTLHSNKELNLPNQKIQVANYRCEEIIVRVEKKYQEDLESRIEEVRNYGDFMGKMKEEFTSLTIPYGKAISQEWCGKLVDKFKVKINMAVMDLLEKVQNDLCQTFSNNIGQNIFFQDKTVISESTLYMESSLTPTTPEEVTFIEECKKFEGEAIGKYLQVLREIGYEVEDRRERMDRLQGRLKKLTNEEASQKVIEITEQFQIEGERKMRMLAATALQDKLGLQFWSNTYEEYRREANQMLASLKQKLFWAKGEYPSLLDIDNAEAKLYNRIVNELQNEFDKNLTERLIDYFNKNFYADQHGTKYNFNAMDQTLISQIYAESKEMTNTLLQALNDFKFEFTKRASFINEEDFKDESKPFMEAHRYIVIKEGLEHKQDEEYYTIVRRRKESMSKKVPWYFFLLVIFFIYDDIPTPEENGWMFRLVALVLVFGAIPFAFGQGNVIMQMANELGSSAGKLFGKLRRK